MMSRRSSSFRGRPSWASSCFEGAVFDVLVDPDLPTGWSAVESREAKTAHRQVRQVGTGRVDLAPVPHRGLGFRPLDLEVFQLAAPQKFGAFQAALCATRFRAALSVA